MFTGVRRIQNRTWVRELAFHANLRRHRLYPLRNLRKMSRSYLVEIQGITACNNSGLSPELLERLEKTGEKCARIGLRCAGASPVLAGASNARKPANIGRKRETLLRRSSPKERRCEDKNGGGGGNRTRVRKRVNVRYYMLSLSFKDSPSWNPLGSVSRTAIRRHTLPCVYVPPDPPSPSGTRPAVDALST